MSIKLRDITFDNYRACLKLRAGDNGKFVATNEYSIAESRFDTNWIIKAVYQDSEMVGFVMYCFSYEKEQLYLCRLMIDEKHQGKGYGLGALNEIKNLAIQDEKINKIKLSVEPENEKAMKIYKKFGFKDMGYLEDGEEVFELKIR